MSGGVREAAYQIDRHLPLLLLADPDEGMIGRYIARCALYEYVEGGRLLGVAAVERTGAASFEIKNIAVDAGSQRRGVGSALLERVIGATRPSRLFVGTADASSEALSFYARNGFAPCGRLAGFFARNYPSPVYDNGRLCSDMILLEWSGGDGR